MSKKVEKVKPVAEAVEAPSGLLTPMVEDAMNGPGDSAENVMRLMAAFKVAEEAGKVEKPLPTLPPIDETKPVVYSQPCALDGASVGSKIVVVRNGENKRQPILAGPDGEHLLAVNDVAWALPEGAKISKHSETQYEAVQLNPNRDDKPLVGATARDVIARFHQHFHG